MRTLIIIAIIFFLLYLLYPFYQRYWASCIDQAGIGCKKGKQFRNDLEAIAYGLSFDEANELSNYLKTPIGERPNFYEGKISGAWVHIR